MYFPSAISANTFDESNSRASRAVFWDKTARGGDHHIPRSANIFLTAAEITTFQGQRPDGVAFDAKAKQRVFLEFTSLMDSVSFSDDGDWEIGRAHV